MSKIKNYSLTLKQFDIEILEKKNKKTLNHPVIAVIGKRGSGKSWAMRSIIYQLRNIPAGVVICPTEKVTGFYKEFFPKGTIFDHYTDDVLSNIIKRQTKLVKRAKYDKSIDPRLLLIMDDCQAEAKMWKNSLLMSELFLNGRHLKITFIFALQYIIGIGPDQRSNVDFAFLLSDDNQQNHKKLYDNFGNFFPTLKSFKQAFTEVTTDYNIMVCNNQVTGGSSNSNIDKKVFYYRAINPPPFKFGSHKFRKYHKINSTRTSSNTMKKREYEKQIANRDKLLRDKNVKVVIERAGPSSQQKSHKSKRSKRPRKLPNRSITPLFDIFKSNPTYVPTQNNHIDTIQTSNVSDDFNTIFS